MQFKNKEKLYELNYFSIFLKLLLSFVQTYIILFDDSGHAKAAKELTWSKIFNQNVPDNLEII